MGVQLAGHFTLQRLEGASSALSPAPPPSTDCLHIVRCLLAQYPSYCYRIACVHTSLPSLPLTPVCHLLPPPYNKQTITRPRHPGSLRGPLQEAYPEVIKAIEARSEQDTYTVHDLFGPDEGATEKLNALLSYVTSLPTALLPLTPCESKALPDSAVSAVQEQVGVPSPGSARLACACMSRFAFACMPANARGLAAPSTLRIPRPQPAST